MAGACLAGSVGVAWDSISGHELKPHAGWTDDLEISVKERDEGYETAVKQAHQQVKTSVGGHDTTLRGPRYHESRSPRGVLFRARAWGTPATDLPLDLPRTHDRAGPQDSTRENETDANFLPPFQPCKHRLTNPWNFIYLKRSQRLPFSKCHQQH